jgi:hypothetical protein
MKNKLKILGVFLFGGGVLLMLEHLVTYGYWEFEVFGHETYGLAMILISFILIGYSHYTTTRK